MAKIELPPEINRERMEEVLQCMPMPDGWKASILLWKYEECEDGHPHMTVAVVCKAAPKQLLLALRTAVGELTAMIYRQMINRMLGLRSDTDEQT